MRTTAGWMLPIICCAAIYSLTLASADWIDFVTGLAIGAGVTWLLRSFMRETATVALGSTRPPIWRRAVWFPIFVYAVLRDVAVGTIEVAGYSLGMRDADYQGIVAVPIGERTRSGVAISAWATTISPGTALVDVDWEAGQMLIHVMDARDPEKVRTFHQRFYDRYQRQVFP
ncbi:Na+/H+ antiporter subunit E [soil metagenome]